MFFFASSFIVGYIYGYFFEWFAHIILHKFGRKKGSWLAFHWQGHHRNCRKNLNYDENYDLNLKNKLKSNGCKEEVNLLFVMLFHLPVAFYFPGFFLALFVSICEYYYKHKKSHIDIEWGKKNMRWHYDHHMGVDQNKNWGIRSDFVDRLFKTRVKYVYKKKQKLNRKS